MAVGIDEMQELVGWRFPGGTYTIPHWENFLLSDVMGSHRLPDGLAHPIYAFNAPMAGMGMTMGDFFGVVRAESDEAIRAGEYDFEFHRPLREGVTYLVEGEITDVTRKRGGRAGLFDLVTFELRMIEPDGALAVTATNSWVLLRRDE